MASVLSTVPVDLREDGEFLRELGLQLGKQIDDYTPKGTNGLSVDTDRWVAYYLDGGSKPRPTLRATRANIPAIVERTLMAMLTEYPEDKTPLDICDRLTRSLAKRQEVTTQS